MNGEHDTPPDPFGTSDHLRALDDEALAIIAEDRVWLMRAAEELGEPDLAVMLGDMVEEAGREVDRRLTILRAQSDALRAFLGDAAPTNLEGDR